MSSYSTTASSTGDWYVYTTVPTNYRWANSYDIKYDFRDQTKEEWDKEKEDNEARTKKLVNILKGFC